MQVNSKLGILFIVTKFGFLFLYELITGAVLLRTRISNDPVFVGTRNS